MSENVKIGRITLLLLLGLFAFSYILANTAADIYYITTPVIGVYMKAEGDTELITVTKVVPGGPADLGGLAAGDTIIALNNSPIRNDNEFIKQLNHFKVGDEVSLTILRDGQILQRSIVIGRRFNVYTKIILVALLPSVIFCYALLLIGTFVFLKKIEDRTAHIFYLMVLFWALAMWHSFPDSLNTLSTILPSWYNFLRMPFWPLAVGLLLHFTLIFPVENQFFKQHRKLVLALVYLPLFLILPVLFAHLRGQDWGENFIWYSWNVLFPVGFFFAMYILGKSCEHREDSHTAKQAQIMLWGTMLTLVLPTGYYYIPNAFFKTTLPFANYVLALLVFWPVTLAYVIIKHRFMDIDVIVKRGVAYALMSGFVVAAYFLLVVGVGKLVLYLTGSNNQLVTIVATLFIAAVFNPVKNRIRLFVDQRFYPSRFSYRKAVREFSHQLINVVDLQRLLDLLEAFFVQTLQIRATVIFWWNPETHKFESRQSADNGSIRPIYFTRNDSVIQEMEKKRALADLSAMREKTESIPDEENERWQYLSAELVLPLLMKSKLVGLICLGAKSDNDPYYKEDLELLGTLNDQVNISLENAFLTEELREQDRLKKELEVARRIQLSTLPQCDPQVPGLDVSGISIPAMEVGGDYYDYLELTDGRFAVVVGDVSGKGTSAALYMTQLKGILKTAAKFHRSLKDLVTEINAITFRSIENKSFITLTCGAFDVRTRRFNFVRAGHLPLMYYSLKQNTCRELLPRGIGVGLEEGLVFQQELEETEIEFEEGDVFVFYSDGIVEARNVNGEEFDTQHLLSIIAANGHHTALSLRETILSQVHAFTGNSTPFDDMTLVVVKVV